MLKLKQRGDAGPCDVFIIFPKAHHPFLHSTQSPETKSFTCFPRSLGRIFRSTNGPAILMVTNVVSQLKRSQKEILRQVGDQFRRPNSPPGYLMLSSDL